MRKTILLAAALAATVTVPAFAQGGAAASGAKPPAKAAPLPPEEVAKIQRARIILHTFNLALQAKEVQQPVKGQLLACLYNNKLSTIAEATNRVFAGNPNLKTEDASVVYRVAAGVCGITFRRVDGAEGTPAPAPARPANNGEGR